MKITAYPLLLLAVMFSCAKQNADQGGSAISDSLRVAQSVDSALKQAMRLGDTSDAPDRMPGNEVPIGSLPLLHSSVLAQFHPNPEGFYRYKSLAYDTTGRGESVSFFRTKDDSMHVLRCIIVDQDERTAATLINQIVELKAKGSKEFDVNGKKIRAVYIEIDGAPAIHGYNPTTNVATLNILCGDHRLVLFREDKATSSDHLIAVAKTMDLKRLTEMVPQ